MAHRDFILSEVNQTQKETFLYDLNYKVIRIGKFLGIESRTKGVTLRERIVTD